MGTFDDRESAFENKFVHDKELEFKIEARRNKLLGLWAADKMGLVGDAAEAYAKEVVKADFEEAGDEDVFRKVSGDLASKGVNAGEKEIRDQMIALRDTARQQILSA
jgi:hypothetical protein